MDEVKTIEEAILEVLREADSPLTTYEIAKRIGASWGSVNTACYKLKDAGLLDRDEIVPKLGRTKKVVWWVKKSRKSCSK